ncbi:MAG TPA: HD domain-containing protein [Solirubrobacteraceae bacterium]|jgi:3'-5' exoribonuclease|nr:HD domain-containing protein [Solirubrobacteraceae bacterium]
MLIRDLQAGREIDQVLLVRGAESRSRRDGARFLRLTLGDRTGQLTAVVWDDVAEAAAIARPGEAVRVIGRLVDDRTHGLQIEVAAVDPAPGGTFSLDDLVDRSAREVGQMEAGLADLLATIRNPSLAALLERFFGEASEVWAAYRLAPAAKYYHQAYRHGLLEHSLTVAQAVSAVSATFPGLDRDLAVTGALLHDIGKLEAYETDGHAIAMSDHGRLQGEIPLGYYRVRRAIEELDGFPAELAQALLHIILSHHGTLEHGSPVVPCTREATLVHMIDNLGGRLGSFDRIEKQLADDQSWSSFDRALGSGAFFGSRGTGASEATALADERRAA